MKELANDDVNIKKIVFIYRFAYISHIFRAISVVLNFLVNFSNLIDCVYMLLHHDSVKNIFFQYIFVQTKQIANSASNESSTIFI